MSRCDRKTHITPPNANQKHHQNPDPKQKSTFFPPCNPKKKTKSPAGHPVNSLTISRCPKTERFQPSKKTKPRNSQSKNQNNSRYAVGVCVSRSCQRSVRSEYLSMHAIRSDEKSLSIMIQCVCVCRQRSVYVGYNRRVADPIRGKCSRKVSIVCCGPAGVKMMERLF